MTRYGYKNKTQIELKTIKETRCQVGFLVIKIESNQENKKKKRTERNADQNPIESNEKKKT